MKKLLIISGVLIMVTAITGNTVPEVRYKRAVQSSKVKPSPDVSTEMGNLDKALTELNKNYE